MSRRETFYDKGGEQRLRTNRYLMAVLATNRFRTVVTVLIILTAACLAIYNIDPVRHYVARTVKHGAICFLQNNAIIKPRRAHYTPDKGTVDIVYCAPINPPAFDGAKMDHGIFVLSDFGHQVQRLNQLGQVVWTQNLHTPRGLDSTEKHLYVGDRKELLILDVDTGEILKRYRYSNYITALKAYRDRLFIAFDDGQVGSLIGYQIDDKMNNVIFRLPMRLASARGIDVSNNMLVIADTFHHKIVKIRLDSNVVSSTKSYYPNSVQIWKDSLLISEEHLNMVSKFSSHSLTRTGAMAGCFDPKNLDSKIEKVVLDDIYRSGTSCNAQHLGSKLYSPNDAIYADGSLYVADTDNHRIVVLKNGIKHSVISGFNNPVNIRLVK
ncbi:hypothetical protein [Sphingorhabdus sp.]|uniref:hypothetical protein n=1 Tax=Sphingorhabdus sp. TaxID=1902408 RepID=UPI00391C94F6